jgi:hypothetical protein
MWVTTSSQRGLMRALRLGLIKIVKITMQLI